MTQKLSMVRKRTQEKATWVAGHQNVEGRERERRPKEKDRRTVEKKRHKAGGIRNCEGKM